MRSINQQPSAGFTLLEILIAIFIFGIIVTTIFGSYRLIFSDTDVIHKDMMSYAMARIYLNRMILDLQSVHLRLPPDYAPPDFADPPDPFRIVGETSDIEGSSFPRLRFASPAHLPLGENKPGGIAEIVYYVQPAGESKYILKRSDNLYPFLGFQEKTNDPILCENIKTLTIKYYDQEGAEYELWNSDSEIYGYATPKAIEIKLELDTGSGSLPFATMVTLPVRREKLK